MPVFYDSNVIVGYHFPLTDGWGDASMIVFSKTSEKYSSTGVWEECFGIDSNGGRCGTINHTIKREFRRILAELKRGTEVIPLLERIVDRKRKDKNCSIFRIINHVASLSKNDREMTIKNLELAKLEYENICFERCKEIKDSHKIIVHRRTTGHSEIYRQLDPHIEDKPDIEVVLDAHDLALTISNIDFYTGDGHILNAQTEILRYTNLSNICDLGDISPYYDGF